MKDNKKTRYFSLTSYATEKQIQKVICDHVKSIRALCYIFHDKDEAEPHYHILIRTHATWSPAQIANWFSGLKDKEKKKINTFAEVANDMRALELYILHQDEKSIEEGKHQYNKEDIKDFGLTDLFERKESYDNSYEILLRVLARTNPRDLVRFYGRDFLYHMNSYYECADKIREVEGYKESAVYSRMELFHSANLQKVEDIDDL